MYHFVDQGFSRGRNSQTDASRSPSEVAYIKISVQKNYVSTDNKWSFDLGVEKGPEFRFFVIVGFMPGEQYHHQ